MAISVVFVNRILTADGAGTSTGANWLATDTVVENRALAVGASDRGVGQASKGSGYMREFAVSNVAADRTVAYFEPGSYKLRVTSAGQNVRVRTEPVGTAIAFPWRAGQDYATDAAANTDPDEDLGLATVDGAAIAGQPANRTDYRVYEIEGPQRLDFFAYTKVGLLASALATNVEIEFAS